jgi:hypothetical protein
MLSIPDAATWLARQSRLHVNARDYPRIRLPQPGLRRILDLPRDAQASRGSVSIVPGDRLRRGRSVKGRSTSDREKVLPLSTQAATSLQKPWRGQEIAAIVRCKGASRRVLCDGSVG